MEQTDGLTQIYLCLRGEFDADNSAAFSDALERVYVYGKHAVQSFADGDEARIMLMGIKRFTKYPMTNTKELRRTVAKYLIEADTYCF